jgi:transcriptional regulator with XRE-family HTH domain
MRSPKKLNLGKALSVARNKASMTLTEMARRASYSTQHMSRVENGHAPVTVDLAKKVAKVLGAPEFLVTYWKVRVEDLSRELKHARGALKEAKARATASAR